ncbi:MAG: HEPN domain-containing protein [Candidatus Gastranaerophilaceae bacterium]|jgi:HEPN domain-containing protein
MVDSNDPIEWLKRAKSNLILGKNTKIEESALWAQVYYEDLCFDLQQAVEKSLKALLILNNIDVPLSHSINLIIDILKSNLINIPEEIYDAVALTPFAVRAKYPGDWTRVSYQEYLELSEIAEKVYIWVEILINKTTKE